jgi:uncharacterized protein
MRLALAQHDVPVPDLDPAHEGLTIAHITDVHVGMMTPERRIRKAVALANEALPDVTVLTGDYMCYSRKYLPAMGEQLRGLAARSGVVCTLGNHDHWTDAAGVARELTANGYAVLRNQNLVLRPRGAPLTIVGIDDAVTRHHDPVKAYAGARRHGTRLVLTHCPELADTAASWGAHLVVAGHTHGGQVNIRRWSEKVYRKVTRKRYLSGWYQVGQALLYVNRGVGWSTVPIRAGEGARSEVAIFTLRRAA